MLGDKIQVENRFCPCKVGSQGQEKEEEMKQVEFQGKESGGGLGRQAWGTGAGRVRESVIQNFRGKQNTHAVWSKSGFTLFPGRHTGPP